MATPEKEIKYCQSCIERGFNPPNIATREYQTNLFYCDECFDAVLQNLTSVGGGLNQIPPNEVKAKLEGHNDGPLLSYIYELYKIPPELQFDTVDTVCRNYEKIFNFHAPAVINRDLDNLSEEHEQLAMSLFFVKYRMETLKMAIDRAKEARRVEKGLKNYQDNKEAYVKPPKAATTANAKLAKKAGVSDDLMAQMIKKAKEREFNKLAGNCPECGGPMPCPDKSHK